jgi:methyl-accepting chemotaxis protein
MKPFHDLPIRRKLLLLTLAPTVAALLLASIGFLTWDIVDRRREIREDVVSEAQVLREGMAPAITFDQPRIVDETLALLKIRAHVRFACAFKRSGERVGAYQRNRAPGCPAAPLQSSFGWETYDVVAPIAHQGETVGTLYISRDLTDVHRRLTVGTGIIAALLLLAIGAALALASGMQRSVSEPLLNLAHIARQISTTRDYSLRAAPLARDEIGVVVRSFNDMLDQIADRTTELG